MKQYDLIVIGGGAGGLTVAAGASSFGARVALIEKDLQPGGDCLHFGCVPSKALLESAKEIHNMKKAANEFGIQLSGKINFIRAKQRIEAAKKIIEKHDSVERFEGLGVDVFHGQATFITNKEILINNANQEPKTIYGKRIVIATGSRPFIPDIPGIGQVDYVTNETIFDLEEAPQRLAVIGGGPIGLEMAQAFSRFGSQVTVFVRSDGIFSKEDQDLVPFATEALAKEINFQFLSEVYKIELLDSIKKTMRLHIQRKSHESNESSQGLLTIEADTLLIAAGRTCNIESLGLEKIGVQTKNGKVVVSDTLQTTVSNIYAVGDVIGHYLFTHAAGHEGKVVIANALFGLKNKIRYDCLPWVTYTDPEFYHVGLTEAEARQRYGKDIEVYKVKGEDVDRFVTDHHTDVYLKVITNSKGHIVGAHAVGKGASSWMQEIVYAKQHGHKIGNISKVIHPYPTHGAILQRAADQYWRKTLFSGILPKIAKKYIQWFR